MRMNGFLNRLFAALLTGIAALGMASQPTLAQDARRLTLTFPRSVSGLDNLDPRVLLTDSHQLIQIGIFEPLIRATGNDFAPGAAESWEMSPDGKTYRFHLRAAQWSDGKPVTGDDFVHAFQRLFLHSVASQIYDDIVNGAELRAKKAPPEALGVTAPDDRTVVITLKNPTPYFLGLISSAIAAPGRADLVAKYGDRYGATVESMAYNGPYLLKEWQNENIIVLKKNPNYWNASSIKLDEVQFLVVPEASTQRNLFDNREIDLYEPVSEAEAKLYEAQGELLRFNRGRYRGLTFNNYGQKDPVKAKILSNPNFRKAISYAIDRQAFVDKVMEGAGLPATVQTPSAHAIYPGKSWGEVTPNLGKYHPVTADLAKSKAYLDQALAEAGIASPAALPVFDFLTSENPEDPKMLTPYLMSVLGTMGLKIKIIQATGNQFWNILTRPALGFDMAIAGWGPDFDDPATYMGYWVSSSMDMGATFDNLEYDALYASANAETDLKKRADILVKVEALFADKGPAIPILHYKGSVAVQPYVKGITTSIFGVGINYLYADIQKQATSAAGS